MTDEITEAPAVDRLIGTVVFFDDVAGWGFLETPSMKAHVFVHYSYIQMAGRRTLKAGQRVEFEVNKRNGRMQAEMVVPLEDNNG